MVRGIRVIRPHEDSLMANETQRWRLISFDIREPKRYRQVAKIIKGYAVRIQYSVFRARMDDRETERLRWELSRVMAEEDALLVVDLCPHCAARVVSKNQVDDWTLEPATVLFAGASANHASDPGDSGSSDSSHEVH